MKEIAENERLKVGDIIVQDTPCGEKVFCTVYNTTPHSAITYDINGKKRIYPIIYEKPYRARHAKGKYFACAMRHDK